MLIIVIMPVIICSKTNSKLLGTRYPVITSEIKRLNKASRVSKNALIITGIIQTGII